MITRYYLKKCKNVNGKGYICGKCRQKISKDQDYKSLLVDIGQYESRNLFHEEKNWVSFLKPKSIDFLYNKGLRVIDIFHTECVVLKDYKYSNGDELHDFEELDKKLTKSKK